MSNLKAARTRLERLQGVRSKLEQDVETSRQEWAAQKRDLRNHKQAREIVKDISRKTQEQLRYHISDITTLALESIFEDPYRLKVDFIERRNQTECDLLFEREGYAMKPMDASGLGAVDVAGFALRVASWMMSRPRTRSVFILDEPFKHLKGLNENLRVIQMVKELSKRLGIQIIMVHDERVPFDEIERGADRVFKVSINRGVTKVETI